MRIKLFLTIYFTCCIQFVASAETFSMNSYVPALGMHSEFNLKSLTMPSNCLEGTLIRNENNQLSVCDEDQNESFSDIAWTFHPPTKNIYKTIADQGNVGLGTTNPLVRLHLEGEAGIIAAGDLGFGVGPSTPVPNGSNFNWTPSISSLSAGFESSATGENSVAFGYQSSAAGKYASAFGSCTADSAYSFCAGFQCNTADDYSLGITDDYYSPSLFCLGRDSTIYDESNQIFFSNTVLGIGAEMDTYGSTFIGVAEGVNPGDGPAVTITKPNLIHMHNPVLIEGYPATLTSPYATREALKVNGEIAFGPNSLDQATRASKNTYILRGGVDPDGNIIEGSGYSVTKMGTGWYRVSYSTIFGSDFSQVMPFEDDKPTAVVSPVVIGPPVPLIPTITVHGAHRFEVRFLNPVASYEETDTYFNFIVAGNKYGS